MNSTEGATYRPHSAPRSANGIRAAGHLAAREPGAMPGLRLTIEDMIAEGDKVVCRIVWRWMDSTGKKMEFHGFVVALRRGQDR